MKNMNDKIRTFRDLEVWKIAHTLVIMIYKTTDGFPPKELFGITSQLRRAGVSITSNLAEGFSRYSYSDKLRFYYMSRGSLSEIQNQLLICKDLEYFSNDQFEELWEKSDHVSVLLNGLIKSTAELTKR